ncbi:hypothetical protein A2Z10_00585 [Candidatus Azambacteria bacterium RBG_16_47_10]|uniref:Four helix bundle protein n=1 Tax=Candidatus Azambacteria bacterium RBG_16_47_10 TaxID=1797292 RepID=A0A1F5AYR9_9BACT|nr:MAG: hypothetical protein A2Z10_00585 [Candidatus Azambacteria bacterium RBG_16_47_10]
MPVHSYKDLIVWQKSVELAVMIYDLVERFPKEEIYGLVSQMKRSAVSIPSNIAEGRYRATRNDYAHFLRISFSSGAELETQIEIAKRLPKTKHLPYEKIDALLEEIMKMLNTMTGRIGSKN